MTHDELLAKLAPHQKTAGEWLAGFQALRAVVELHKPVELPNGRIVCDACVVTIKTKINPLQDFEYTAFTDYPCKTIQAIEKELK